VTITRLRPEELYACHPFDVIAKASLKY